MKNTKAETDSTSFTGPQQLFTTLTYTTTKFQK